MYYAISKRYVNIRGRLVNRKKNIVNFFETLVVTKNFGAEKSYRNIGSWNFLI